MTVFSLHKKGVAFVKKVTWTKVKLRLKHKLMFVRGRLFYFLHQGRIDFASPPYIDGVLPKIVCEGKIILGHNCVFSSFRLGHHLAALNGGVLEIGANAFINDGVNICAMTSIKIGNDVKIGDMAYIYDSDFHSITHNMAVRTKAVSIGNNVWIGAHSSILAGVSIGDHAVIGAGSIVTKDVPPRSVAAGNPARVIKTFEAPEGWVRS